MGRFRSVRAKTTIVATVVFTLALGVALTALIVTLRSSLIDEVDRALETRVAFIESQLVLPETGGALTESIRVAGGFDTLELLIEEDGSVEVSSDPTGDPKQVLDADPGTSEPFTADLSSFVDTDGSDNMRVLVVLAEIDEEKPPLVAVASSLDDVSRTTRTVTLASLVVSSLLVLLVGLLVWRLVGRALTPVGRIQAEVEEITVAGLDRRVEEPKAEDEVGRLARTMNRMLARIETAQNEQQRFIADASHELRTPLAGMMAQIDVDLAHPETANWPQTARDLREQTGRLKRLVDDMLLLAYRPSPASSTESLRLVDIDDIVLEEARTLGATRPGVIDTHAVSAGLARGNEDELRRVVRNLIANALRHAKSTVVLGLSEDDGTVRLTVDDDGDGIPEDDRGRIFDRFTRLDDARTRDHGGSGLGLAICKEIVERHAGTIGVGDAPVGGARFEVRLPTAF